MRRILIAAASTAVLLVGAGGASAMTFNGSGIRAAADAVDSIQDVRRVCREVCREGFCRQRCYDDGNTGYRERRVYRDYDDTPSIYYDRPRYYDPAPGIGVYGPGFGIGIGPGW